MTGDVAKADVVTTTADPYTDRDDAVDALFRRHCSDLVRLAFCLLGDRGAAEEVVQDAFLALHRHWWGLRAYTSAVPYLRAAVVNGCRSRQRRMVRARALTAALRPLRTAVTSSEESAMVNDEQARTLCHNVPPLHLEPGRQSCRRQRPPRNPCSPDQSSLRAAASRACADSCMRAAAIFRETPAMSTIQTQASMPQPARMAIASRRRFTRGCVTASGARASSIHPMARP